MDAPGPEWTRRPLVDQLGILVAQLFHKIWDCRLPINIGPTVAPQPFASWNVLTDTRISRCAWVLAPNDPALKENFGVASRNVTRARFCFSLGEPRAQADSDDLLRDAAGHVIVEPS